MSLIQNKLGVRKRSLPEVGRKREGIGRRWWLIGVWLALVLVGCGGGAAAVATPSPGAMTSAPGPTATPRPACLVVAFETSLLAAPALDAAVVARLYEGSLVWPVGYAPGVGWWQVETQQGQIGWVFPETVVCTVAPEEVPAAVE